MRLEAIELHRVALPLVRPFETSFGRETERDVLLVHVHTDEGDGWGECVAGRDPFYSSEYVEGAAAIIERYLVPPLFDVRQLLVAPIVAELRIQRLPTLLPMNGGALITND